MSSKIGKESENHRVKFPDKSDSTEVPAVVPAEAWNVRRPACAAAASDRREPQHRNLGTVFAW